MMGYVRTRFAPSPTGFLHIGGLRTALYSYLVARQTKGVFIVRIEDTDRERTVPGAVENILESLQWAGLQPDEGVLLSDGVPAQVGAHGPYIQSDRFELYRDHAQKLIDTGYAYYAFDTKEELDAMREAESAAGNPAPKYDASVRMRMKNSLTLSKEEVDSKMKEGEPYVVRMKVPEGNVIRFTDEIRGNVEFRGMEVDDQILLKSDGFPTYHLANVVDDHLMEIDMVIRGEEWLSSTPKHLLLFEYFGWPAPRYAHVPLLMNKGGGKLSKRQNDVAVRDYIDKGYLPEALINFVTMLGWNPGTTQEMFTLEALVEQFSLERIQKSGAVFDLDRLDWYQGQWMRSMTPDEFAQRIRPLVVAAHPKAGRDKDFSKKAALIQERISLLPEAPEMMKYFYEEPTVTMELLAEKKQGLTKATVPEMLDLLIKTLEPLDDWNEEHLKNVLFKCVEDNELKKGQLLWPLRAALTGLPFSPGAFEVAAVLGKEETMRRLNATKAVIG